MDIHSMLIQLRAGVTFIRKSSLATHVKLWREGRYKYFAPIEELSISGDNHFICWHNGGSSAVKNTEEDLAWTLEKIFDGAKPEDFIPLDYHTMLDVMNSEYGKVRE